MVMPDKIITILTSWGKFYGNGHIQRMTTLLWYLNQKKGTKALFVTDSIPESFPKKLHHCITSKINTNTDIIIRDMRDSSLYEIEKLKKISRVMVIDDNGEGHRVADYKIDLLPNLERILPNNQSSQHNPYDKTELKINNTSRDNQIINKNFFFFGYNFVKSLLSLKNKTITKKIDFSIYPGSSIRDDYIHSLISILPEKSSIVIHSIEGPYLLKKGERYDINKSYAEIILSSKILISHFGIMLYEGNLAKCRLIVINPSIYHSRLSEVAKESLDLINLGEYIHLNKKDASISIEKALREPLCDVISTREVYNTVTKNLDSFYEYLLDLIIEQ